MQRRLGFAALVIVSMLAETTFGQIQAKSCPLPPGERPSGPDISIAEVTFSGSIQLPLSEQRQVATAVQEKTRRSRLEDVVDSASELTREGWQNHGYFTAQVSGSADILPSDAVGQRVALNMQVEEGRQYRFGEITVKNNKAISSDTLRAFFPIRRGEVFNREEMTAGLDNLRKAYDELGYANFVPVPEASIDEQSQSVSFEIDIDEGRQFHFAAPSLIGFDDDSRQRFLADFPTGQVYSRRRVKQFLEDRSSIVRFLSDDPFHLEIRFNERTGTVAITLDARPCAE